METLGQRIKIARGENKQEYFASKLSVDRTTLSSWEIDRREPYLGDLMKIAKMAKVSVEWLLTGKETAALDDLFNYPQWREWKEIVEFAAEQEISPEEVMLMLRKVMDEKNSLTSDDGEIE